MFALLCSHRSAPETEPRLRPDRAVTPRPGHLPAALFWPPCPAAGSELRLKSVSLLKIVALSTPRCYTRPYRPRTLAAEVGPMARKVTIEDIARQSNASASTVSLVLRNRPGISAPTRRRVLDAARALG